MFDVGSTAATLTINVTGGVVTGTNNYITGVDLGFTSQAVNVTGFSSVPSGSWTNSDFTTSLGNNGCGTNNGAFVCASGSGVQIGPYGGTYVFTWTYDPIDMNFVDAVGDIHIGANYGPHNGLIVSQTIGRAPEPNSMLLLFGGLGAFALLALRRR